MRAFKRLATLRNASIVAISAASLSVVAVASQQTELKQARIPDEDQFEKYPVSPSQEAKVEADPSLPGWLQDMINDHRMWWVTQPDSHFDISQHFIYSSLIKSGVIERYFYFVERSPKSELGPEIRIVYKLGRAVCGHDGLCVSLLVFHS